MQRYYLKGYYGYRNLGDEILLIGVLHYLVRVYEISSISVEVADVAWMQHRYATNQSYFPSGLVIQRVPVPGRRAKIVHILRSWWGSFPHLVLGGGEVMTRTATFPHNGRNYLLIYMGNIWRRRYTLLGGVTTCGPDDRLARYLVSRASQVVMRDTGSYDQIATWRDDAVLYHDFALDALALVDRTKSHPDHPYRIINTHPSKMQPETRAAINDYLASHEECQIYYVPCDVPRDMQYREEISRRYPTRQLYDWTQYSLSEIVAFFGQAVGAWGMRLHFLLLCDQLDVSYEYHVYHPKVTKILSDLSS